MAYLVFFILLKIAAVLQASKSRSVNLSLETVLEFDKKDDLKFIDTIQNFLQKLKTTISKNIADNNDNNEHIDQRSEVEVNDGTKKHFVFTDFLLDAINVLKSYKDDDLKMFFNTFQKEIKTLQAKREFHEITGKLGFRRLININLQSLRNSPMIDIRRKLSNLFDNIKFNNRNGYNDFVDAILDYVYKKESKDNFRNILNNLKLYRTTSRRRNITELKRTIRNGIMTIIDPLLKLNSETISNLNGVFYKYIADDMKYVKDLPKNIKTKEVKSKTARQKYEFKNVLKDNEILDYIEDHIKVIDRHLTTKDLVNKGRSKSKQRKGTSTGFTNKNVRTTKSRKHRKVTTKQERDIIRPHEMKTQWTTYSKDEPEKDDSRMPVLINLSSDDDSELSNVESYLSTTKPHKKITRPKLTPKKSNVYSKTTKKYRKAFKTSTLSVEGLSIEHFGSLFGREFHRKSNDNDTFGQIELNSSTATNNVSTIRDDSDVLSKEIQGQMTYRATDTKAQADVERMKNNNVTIEKEGYHAENSDEQEIEEDKKVEQINEIHDLGTESMKIKGNIIIGTSSEVTTHNKIEMTTSGPVQTTTYRNYNVSLVTKYFNIMPLKPTILFKSHDVKILNKTNITQGNSTTPFLAQTNNVKVNESKNDVMNLKPTGDHLVNEIEDMMDKFNSTTIPVELENLIKVVEEKPNENKKVKEQMQADLAKLLAPPSTKSTVTQLFTDPFDDIDAGADIL